MFTIGWILIIFNLPSFLGALSLLSNRMEDIEFNRRGIYMYLIGYVKAIFMLLILGFASFQVENLEGLEDNEEIEKLEFFKELKTLCELNSICDFVYSLVGICIIKLTRDILQYLKEKELMGTSSFLSEERTNTRFLSLTYAGIELRNLRE